MHSFTLDTTALLTPEIVRLLTAIHECKGKQELYALAHPDMLASLLTSARIQSTGASNRIEGIFTSDKRLTELVEHNATPLNRSEEEIAGYRKVLDVIHENHSYIPPKASIVLQLHRDLYSFSGSSIAGRWKGTDNTIEEQDAQGNRFIRFRPLSAFETPDAMQSLCIGYLEAIDKGQHDPLLLTCMYVLDFLCIHPFGDGNGRMSRLLTLLMLYRSGYIVGKYISLERLIEQTKSAYYDTLFTSSQGWHTSENSYEAFTRYLLGIILAAYQDFNSRIAPLGDKKLSKPDRIRQILASRLEPINRQGLMALCPDISEATMKATLAELVKEGFLLKIGAARATTYIRNHNAT